MKKEKDKIVPLFKPDIIREKILPDLEGIMKSGWIGLGPKTEELEARFAKYVGSKYAVAVNSCTSALHLALKIFNIGDGDVVATTPMSFISTNSVLIYQRAIPVFIDVNPNTMCMDVEKLISEINWNKEIKAIIVVHYGGTPMDMKSVYEIAATRNIPVIEDAAHAAGARYDNGLAVGSNTFENGITCFSFHAVKNMPLGDGGMLTTNGINVAQRLKRLRWLGIDKSTYVRDKGNSYSWMYSIDEVGYKYHCNDISSIIGLRQLEVLEEHNDYRRKIWKWYFEQLQDVQVDFIDGDSKESVSSRHLVAIKVDKDKRDALLDHLNANNIQAGVHYYPNHLYSIFSKYCVNALEVVEEEWQKLISLPCHLYLEKKDVDRICLIIKKFLNKGELI